MVVATALAPSCAPSGTRGGVSGRAPAHPFGAVRLEVHPLTRVVRDSETGSLRIEAHVELFDRWGDTVKDVGEFRFELYRAAGLGADADSMTQELVWRQDLTDPEANSRQFDAITRTYTSPLLEAPDWLERPGRGTLVVSFTTSDGRRLVGSRRLDQ